MSNPKHYSGNEFVKEAYGLEDQERMTDFYQKWADDYDHQMLDNLNYLSPDLIAKLLINHLKFTEPHILDIGCGTGLTSQLLHQQGYQNIDGLDFSADMLRVAAKRAIYRNLIEADLSQPLTIADQSYDAALSSGTFTHGHVGPEPFDEIFRVLKKDGLLACTIHLDLWQSKGFDRKLQQLTDSGSIQCLHQEKDIFYQGGEPEGWFCVYQKL